MWRKSYLDSYIDKLKTYYFKYGNIPNFKAVADLFWVNSKWSVHKIFTKLTELGLLSKEWQRYYPTEKFTAMPMYESVQAWFPSPAKEDNKYDINLQSYLVENPNSTIFLKVVWDSMNQTGIVEWDIVIVDKSIKEKKWNIVVAIVDWDYTIKFLMQDKGWQYYLQAANPKYDDIYPEEELQVFWVVIWSFRSYKNNKF